MSFHVSASSRTGLGMPPLPPDTPLAPTVIPKAPSPYWSWDRIPTSYHGAVKDRVFNDDEVARLAKYQMVTIEKWYTPCASAGPTQSGPDCAVEKKIEHLISRIRSLNPNITANLYWNSMFDFAFYGFHQGMLDLEKAGVKAFLRDKFGTVVSLCNDGNVYCNITNYDWTVPQVRELWVGAVYNATQTGFIDGIFADHSSNEGVAIGGAKDDQGPNQLCNGRDSGRQCFNFTSSFTTSFNSWHLWATNFTQDMLSHSTGGPVVQGPLASMNEAGTIHDPSFCDFTSILTAQRTPMGRAGGVFEARGPCDPREHCIASYLAAAEPGTYMHCTHNGDDLLNATTFPQMDYPLGPPDGPAVETPAGSQIWVRKFASGTVVTFDNSTARGTGTKIVWGSQKF